MVSNGCRYPPLSIRRKSLSGGWAERFQQLRSELSSRQPGRPAGAPDVRLSMRLALARMGEVGLGRIAAQI
jgi:hypothetical protein